ncbi:MAG: hybrid sensor histidine kinase/response regulator [Kangiellaceae bacterium]|nr:hybrid sensor histidine kinase/response regulator [Kangiellaceae bacterium]
MDHWLVISIALIYLLLLFVIAEYAERRLDSEKPRPWIYSLSLAIYCTSWAMFGTVAQTESTGWFIAPTYVGAILVLVFAWPVLATIIRIAKQNKVTSIADFIAARFGSSHLLGGIVVLICLVAIIPYISLQLKAIVNSYSIITSTPQQLLENHGAHFSTNNIWKDSAFYISAVVAIFTLIFGTRRADATEHHQGIMLAIAFESIIKLTAFLAVGLFTVFYVFDGFTDLWQQSNINIDTARILNDRQPSFVYWSQVLLGMIAVLCLPRQFHVLVVENRSEQELKKSRWIFPSYLLLINLFILPITIAGRLYFQDGSVSAEDYILRLPIAEDNSIIAMIVFIGGISAATSMIIVATIVLSTMVSNEIIVPFVVKFFSFKLSQDKDHGRRLLVIRRGLILLILLMAYGYYRAISVNEQLATTGLFAMALIAQLAPAIIAGVYWKRCTQKATIIGLTGGLALWSYTLLLPLLTDVGYFEPDFLAQGPFGISLLRPEQFLGLYGFDRLTHGLIWSLLANIALIVYFSIRSEQSLSERIQTSQFLSNNPQTLASSSTLALNLNVADLVLLAERFLGKKSSKEAFDTFCSDNKIDTIEQANINQLTRYTEKLLQAIIGSTSTRLIFESLGNDRQLPFEDVFSMIDEATDVLLFNRELLQSAIENISHGISVVDKDLHLVAWNSQYIELFEYPEEIVQVGRPIEDLVRHNAKQGMLGNGNIEELISKRLQYMRRGSPHVYERKQKDDTILEMRGNPMPGGGFVTSFIDITEFRNQQYELQASNQQLEVRVGERTEELEQLNHRLLEAKSMAELANHSKTRFLAAASHDVLQPLNAASLFSATLSEQVENEQQKQLTHRIQQSLTSAEQLLKDLIDISKLDSGHITSEMTGFSLDDLMKQLSREFEILAQEKNIKLRTVFCDKTIYSDRTMLRRVLQNLLSNAIQHSESSTILFGCRRHKSGLDIHVIDQGRGISQLEHDKIFEEFVQLGADKIAIQGHGLGLAIVARILKILNIPLRLESEVNKGSNFSVSVPLVEGNKQSSHTPNIMPVSFKNQHIANKNQLILCIDNEQNILDGMGALLESWGYHNLLISLDGNFNGQENFKIDDVALILADYHLEDNRTGVDVIEEIRKEANWDVPSVVITADQTEKVKRIIQEHSVFLLHKPVKPLSLRTLLNRLMRS